MDEYNDFESRLLKRKHLLVQFILEFFESNPDSEDVALWGNQMEEYDPLLKKAGSVLSTLDKITEDLKPDFKYNGYAYFGRQDDLLTIEVGDRKRLKQYFHDLERKLSETKHQYQFILDQYGKLYLDGSKLPPYEMKRGSLRHKIVFYLAKENKSMSANELVEKIKGSTLDAKRVRTTVGQIRTMVKKKFKLPGDALIQSSVAEGYNTTDVTLKVRKGYTP